MDNDNKKPAVNRVIVDFRTRDLPLAAFLRIKNHTIKEVNKVSKTQVEFVFDKVEKSLLDAYYTDSITVEPRLFAAVMRQQHTAAQRVINEDQ